MKELTLKEFTNYLVFEFIDSNKSAKEVYEYIKEKDLSYEQKIKLKEVYTARLNYLKHKARATRKRIELFNLKNNTSIPMPRTTSVARWAENHIHEHICFWAINNKEGRKVALMKMKKLDTTEKQINYLMTIL